MFMDISPKLFDDCTNRYKQSKQIEKKKLKEYEEIWLKLEAMAEQNAGQNVALNTLVKKSSIRHGNKIDSRIPSDSYSDDNCSESDMEEEDVLTKDISRSKFNVFFIFNY